MKLMEIVDETKKKSVVVRMKWDLFFRIERIAKQDDESMSTTIKRLLREALDRRDTKE